MPLQNILVIRSDRLGEFLLTLPAIKLIRENYPQSRIILLADKNNLELAKSAGFVDGFKEYRPIKNYFKEALLIRKIINDNEIDTAIAFNPKKSFHFGFCLGRARVRIGYDHKWGFCLNRKIKDEKNKAQKHEIEYNFDLAGLICRRVYLPNVSFSFSELEKVKEKFIVIHPFSSNYEKELDSNFWKELIKRIKKEREEKIAIIGIKEEAKKAEELQGEGVYNFCGRFSLKQLGSFLKYNCFCFIGLDSGPMHLASLLNKPTVGIFKASNSTRWGPYGSDCLVVRIKKDSSPLERIMSFIQNIEGKMA